VRRHDEYDTPLGAPHADAVVDAQGVWSRSFAHMRVSVDVPNHSVFLVPSSAL
jgi:hypothetical protein